MEDLQILLLSKGVISYFKCRRPTMQEMSDDHHFAKVEMSLLGPWDPSMESMAEEEDAIRASLAWTYVRQHNAKIYIGFRFLNSAVYDGRHIVFSYHKAKGDCFP
jgi:hypothetical protein